MPNSVRVCDKAKGLLCGALATGNTFIMAATIPRTVLLTRPKAASERFAALIDAPCVISPLMKTLWVSPETVPPHDALVFTSETGVAGWIRLNDTRGVAYCVGDRTADKARDAGFEAHSAHGSAQDLIGMLDSLPSEKQLLHVRGVHAANDLGDHVTPYVVYEQRACSLLPEAKSLLRSSQEVVLPFFSVRSVALFQAQSSPLHATLFPVAISQAVSDAISRAGMGNSVVAERPDGEAMLRATRSLLV